MSTPVLEIIDLRKSFGETLVLHDVNLTVPEHTATVLIGASGSGKSTLLRCINLLEPIDDGLILLDGQEISDPAINVDVIRRKLGIVFQDFQLLTDRNVLDNLMFVLSATGWKNKHEMLDRCKAVLEKVGLQTKDYKIPAELSGGEQQRLVIARALLNDPKVLLADEPTGNLDPEVSDEIMMLLKNIAREGTSILMATHDYRLIQKFGGTVCKLEDRTLKQVDSFQIS